MTLQPTVTRTVAAFSREGDARPISRAFVCGRRVSASSTTFVTPGPNHKENQACATAPDMAPGSGLVSEVAPDGDCGGSDA